MLSRNFEIRLCMLGVAISMMMTLPSVPHLLSGTFSANWSTLKMEPVPGIEPGSVFGQIDAASRLHVVNVVESATQLSEIAYKQAIRSVVGGGVSGLLFGCVGFLIWRRQKQASTSKP